MPLTKQQAETVADSILAGTRAEREEAPAQPVPFVYRSTASRRLERQQESLAYKQVTSRPLNRNPVFVAIMLVCVAFVVLLFWREGGRLSGAELALAIMLLTVPHIVGVIVVRQALAKIVRDRA